MKYLCDTCILIDYLRGKEEIKNTLSKDRTDGLGMSSITYMELMVGAFNKREINTIKKAFADFEIVELSAAVSIKASKLIETYSKSHGLLIPDALIAATALEYNIPLYTANVSDFRFIPDLVLI
ncbi:MAG: type II toxin-antitoxin system VapC family toxin [Lachnospiraceae bacterium]|nr:type II toxin-antitoxin system VapC family toxin [Lachnospiraceae bacterium]